MYRLLVVDDEETILRGLVQTIDWNSFGYSVVGTAVTGADALELVPETSPEVILTDINMPGTDGISLLKAIKHHYPEIKVVLVSGYDEFKWAQEALRHGAEDYILKHSLEEDIERVFGKLYCSLEEQRSEQRREKERQDRYESLAIEKLLLSIIHGEVETSEKETAEESGYFRSVQSETYCIVCFVAENDPDDDYDIQLPTVPAERIISTIRRESKRTFAVPVSANEVVVFLPCGRWSAVGCREHARRLARNIVVSLGRNSNTSVEEASVLNIAAGIGEAGRGWESLRLSYEHALLAAMRQTETATWFVCEWHNIADSSPMTYDLSQQNRVLDGIVRGDAVLSVDAIRDMFERMKFPDGAIDVKEARSAVIELIGVIYHQLHEVGMRVDREYNSVRYIYDRLHEVHTLTSLKKYTTKIVREMANIVHRRQTIKSAERIQTVVEYIRHNVAKRHTQHDLAKMAGISPSHFSVLFRKYTEKSLTDFLIELRMEKARELLRAGKGVSETAHLLGYEDVPHFRKMFKRCFGESPAFRASTE